LLHVNIFVFNILAAMEQTYRIWKLGKSRNISVDLPTA